MQSILKVAAKEGHMTVALLKAKMLNLFNSVSSWNLTEIDDPFRLFITDHVLMFLEQKYQRQVFCSVEHKTLQDLFRVFYVNMRIRSKFFSTVYSIKYGIVAI